MKNKVSDGKTISILSENYAGKDSGDPIRIGKIYGVCGTDNPVATGKTYSADIEGVFDLPKLTEGITQGSRLYFDGSSVCLTPTGGVPIGVAMADALTGDTTVPVKINACPPTGYYPTGAA